jgi:NO-binding membrane sensor protein with MHYT domain
MDGHHNLSLVALSLAVAVIAPYTVLDLSTPELPVKAALALP